MLNYNLNINSPLQQEKKNEDVRPPIYWDFHSFASASDSSDLSERTFATMSINAVNTNCIQVSVDSGNSFVSDAQSPVTASVTGSNWPITGSTTMSLFTAGITYDPLAVDQFYFSSVSASGTQIIANPSISGSIITNKFLTSEFYRWYVSGSVIHIKGNVFNPLVKVLATGSNSIYSNSQGTNTILNIVKNVNEPISMSIGYITGSQTSSFQYEYAFNITSSLTGSANWPRSASHLYPTMSLSIPEAGINVISYQTASIITASFAANTNTTYTITASVAPRYIPGFTGSFTLFAGGGGGVSTTSATSQPGGGGGAGAMFTGSFNISPNRTYTVVVGDGGAADTSGGTTQFNGFDMGVVEIPITMSLQGGRNGSAMNGGNSGTGSYTIGTTTTQLPAFTGGSGDDGSGGGTLRFAAGGGAGSCENGVSGVASPNRVSGRGGNGNAGGTYKEGGGGGGGGADRRNFVTATAGAGGIQGGGNGGQGLNQGGSNGEGYGAGGGGAVSTDGTAFGGSGYQGVLTVSYQGTGSRFTTIGNATSSFTDGITTYTFNVGSSSFSYVYEPELNPAPLT
jgi:hypothetical protein